MIFKQELYLKEITKALALLRYSTHSNGILGLLDQNIISESFFAKLLNLIYDYNLTNLNKFHKNFPAIDLGDYEKKVCFQVTYTSREKIRTKIVNTIDKFVNNKLYNDFNQLRFLFLGPKRNRFTKKINTYNKLNFDPLKDILDLDDLVSQLNNLSTDRIGEVYKLFDKEFCEFKKVATNKEIIDAIKSRLIEIEILFSQGLVINNSLIQGLQVLFDKLPYEYRNIKPGINTLSTKIIDVLHEFNKLPRKPGRIDVIADFIKDNDFTGKIVDIRMMLGE